MHEARAANEPFYAFVAFHAWDAICKNGSLRPGDETPEEGSVRNVAGDPQGSLKGKSRKGVQSGRQAGRQAGRQEG